MLRFILHTETTLLLILCAFNYSTNYYYLLKLTVRAVLLSVRVCVCVYGYDAIDNLSINTYYQNDPLPNDLTYTRKKKTKFWIQNVSNVCWVNAFICWKPAFERINLLTLTLLWTKKNHKFIIAVSKNSNTHKMQIECFQIL